MADDAGNLSDSVCAVCSKPIRLPALSTVHDGQPVHGRCAGRELRLRILEGRERIRQAKRRAARLIQEAEAQLRARSAQSAPVTPSRPDPVCAICGEAIPRGSPLAVREGRLCHWPCAE